MSWTEEATRIRGNKRVKGINIIVQVNDDTPEIDIRKSVKSRLHRDVIWSDEPFENKADALKLKRLLKSKANKRKIINIAKRLSNIDYNQLQKIKVWYISIEYFGFRYKVKKLRFTLRT